MAPFGRQLRTARERRGLARSEVAEAISIYIHDLAALEFADFAVLPGDDDVVEGFVRTYAEFLELDVDAIVEDYRHSRPGRVTPTDDEAPVATPETETVPEESPELEPPVAVVEPSIEEPVPVEVPAETPEVAVEDPVEAGPSIGGPAPSPESVSREPATPRSIPVARIAFAVGALAIVAIVVGWSLAGGEPDPSVAEPGSVPAPVEVSAEVTTTPESTDGATPVDEAPRTPTTEAAPPPAPRVGATLRVTEFGVGSGVVDRRLVGESERFAAGSRVWFWTRVVGGARGASVDHVWIYEGRVVDRVTLDVGSANWRTHSAKQVYEIGRWAVEARDPGGAVLARGEFDCVGE